MDRQTKEKEGWNRQDGWMDKNEKWMDRKKNRWKDRRVDKTNLMDRLKHGCMHGEKEQMDRWTINVWMDGWIKEWIK